MTHSPDISAETHLKTLESVFVLSVSLQGHLGHCVPWQLLKGWYQI